MRRFGIILGLALSSMLQSQTTVFFANADGTADKSKFYYFDHSNGMIYDCFGCKEKEIIKNAYLKIDGNKVIFCITQALNFNEKTKVLSIGNSFKRTELGYLDSNKNIIRLSNDKPQSSSENNNAFIKDNRIYNTENKIIGIIEGEEIYGAAWYLILNN